MCYIYCRPDNPENYFSKTFLESGFFHWPSRDNPTKRVLAKINP